MNHSPKSLRKDLLPCGSLMWKFGNMEWRYLTILVLEQELRSRWEVVRFCVHIHITEHEYKTSSISIPFYSNHSWVGITTYLNARTLTPSRTKGPRNVPNISRRKRNSQGLNVKRFFGNLGPRRKKFKRLPNDQPLSGTHVKNPFVWGSMTSCMKIWRIVWLRFEISLVLAAVNPSLVRSL